ncbi:nicotinate-nucleotide--dimethylbenzimidazole phosphoribosyltransferase [Corynebacterium mendelii]|uniref:Nicotinate-nucleotide--dimethylbenzimidazole phosphoribosyltransferase n=1 Tax=Corynebacterium mendelii TaxID=2765362 RepID=A0A939DXJ7_9CORY|nr:nicotinate-nucleotide--dimethylbenzimidazole phosphoribosyltransferase [Corynebacterium mendelii]MBN9643059.1 nicotinate-nucleotide--dimethylbenzimidazole phosphoribosyltransferase [Corynebacterium mendelii]
MDPAQLYPPITPPDERVLIAARQYQDQLTKPQGCLGRLEDIGCFIAACQGEVPPRKITDPSVVVFAGDHGIAGAAQGVSPFPQSVSLAVADNIVNGTAGIAIMSRAAGARVRVADISLDHEAEGPYRIRRSCGSIDREDAMTDDEVARAIEIGQKLCDEEVDKGADLLIAGEIGIGNTTPSAALVGCLLNKEPVAVVGRGSGINDEGWKTKTAAVRDAMFRSRNHRDNIVELLRMVTGPDITAMAAFLAQAAVRRTPVILDGVITAAAALAANRLAPGARHWWIAGHRSAEPAQGFALKELDLVPLIDFHMRLGEGTGAVAALPLVTMAVDIMVDMPTFAESGVAQSTQ